MTSEEIIERLIDEKKLSVKEAMIIMKDLAEESVRRMFYPPIDNLFQSEPWYHDNKVYKNTSIQTKTINLSNSNETE